MAIPRTRAILLILFILIGILSAGLFVLSRRVNEASGLLAGALTQRLGREITLGAVRWRPWGQVIVDGVAMARWERLAEGPALRADRLTMTLDPLALLTRRLRVTRLELTRPEFWVEVTAEGRSNWESLLMRRSEGQWQSEWSGITFKEGRVVFLDRRHDLALEAEGINVTLAVKSGEAVSGAGRAAMQRLAGRWAGRSVDLGPISARLRWAGPAVTLEQFDIVRGRTRLSGIGEVALGPAPRFAFSVRGQDLHEMATLHPALVHLGKFHLPLAQVRIHGDREKLILSDLSLKTAGGVVTGDGSVRWDSAHPVYQFGLQAQNLRLSELWPGTGLVGTVGGSASIAGSAREGDGVAVEAMVKLQQGGVTREGDRPSPFRSRLAQLGPILEGEARLRYRARRLEVLSLGIQGKGQQIRLQGDIHEGRLALRGEGFSTDLAVWVPDLRGEASILGELTGSFDNPRLVVQLDGRLERWGDVPLGRVALRGQVGREEFSISSLLVEESEGRVTGAGRLRWAPSGDLDSLVYEVTGRVENSDLSRLISLTGRNWPVAGRVSGPISIKGQGGRLAGTADVMLSRASAWGERIEGGRASLSLEAGTLSVSQAELRGAWGRLVLHGEGTQAALAGRVELRDLRLEGFQALTNRWPGLEGRGGFQGNLGGTIEQPNLSGAIALTDLRRGEISLGRVNGTISVANQRISADVILPALGSQFQGEVSLAEARPFVLSLRARAAPVSRLQALVPSTLPSWVTPLDGEVSGSARLHGEIGRARSALLELNLDQAKISVDGQRWENRGPLRVTGSLERLELAGEFQAGEGRLRIRGQVEPARFWDLNLEGNIPLSLLRGGRLHPALQGLSGFLRGQVAVRGPWTSPTPNGHFSLERLRFAPEGWPPVELVRAEGRVAGDRLTLDRVEGRTDGGRFEGSGHVALRGVTPQAFSLRLGITELTVHPAQLLNLIRPGAPRPGSPEAAPFWEEGRLRLSGMLEGEGIWGRADTLRLQVRLSRLVAKSGRLEWTNVDAVKLSFRERSLTMEPFTVTGMGTRVTLSGQVGPARHLDLTVAGPVSLALLEQFPQYVRGASGSADLRLHLQGNSEAPRVDGVLAVSSARLDLRRISEPLILKEGRLRFDGVRLSVDRLSGQWGDGEFTLTGWAERGPGLTLKSLQLALKGSDLRFRVADLGRGTLDLDLQVEGEGRQPLVRGDLVLRRAVYSRDIQPTAPQRLRRWEEVVAGLPPPIRAIRFDVKLRAPGDVWIRNNLARVEIRGDLVLKGTFAEPILFGQAEVVRGNVVYRQREFKILAGRVDFLDPRRINPQFTVSAETLAQGVRVQITLQGRLDHFTVQLASDPPLSQQQIQALIAGGAAGFVAGEGLPGKVVEQAGRIAKLDVFQIEPTPESGGMGARVSAGKRLGERLEVNYSRTITTSPTQRVTAEYQLTDAISLIGSQDERGAFGFDVRFSLSFR